MSVIFEALQKIRGSEEPGEEKGVNSTDDRGNTKTLSGIVFSPGLLMLVLAIGGIVWFLYYYLKDTYVGGGVKDRGRVVAVATKPSKEKVLPRAGGHGKEKDTQGPGSQEEIQPPPSISYHEAKMVSPYPDEGAMAEQAGPTFLPPLTDSGGERDTFEPDKGFLRDSNVTTVEPKSSSLQGMPGSPPPQASLKGGIDPFESPLSVAGKATARDPLRSSFRGPVARVATDKKNEDHSETSQGSISSGLDSPGNKGTAIQCQSPEEVNNSPLVRHNPCSHKEKKINSNTAPDIIKLKKDENYQKTVQTSSLVSQFYRALTDGDDRKAGKLIEKLKILKGPEHPFVLKLEAYWHIKRKNWSLAKKGLERVLSKKPADFEAGINMAIVEIRQGNIKGAKKRLKRLRDLYPGQCVVTDMLAKLPADY